MTPFQIVEAEMMKRGERIDALEAENAALKKRIEWLEKDKERLAGAFRKAYWEGETLRTEKRELEAERNEWFTKYQVRKERTDNYDFLLWKTREQEKEIYSLIKKINELGG